LKQHIVQADETEAEALVALINQAYGPAESFLYDGQRIETEEVRARLRRGAFLILVGDDPQLCGTVYVECRESLGYFGLLSERPRFQRRNLGRVLVDAAERYCIKAGCETMEIEVVNHRTELLAYYATMGYSITGERPFVFERLRMPSHFLVMRKTIASPNSKLRS
jgi:GNAT superfamily N-acetyltransferase